MNIQMAILGLLDWQPCSGYDLKKRFADSSVFYWSGNNNQVYKALLQLHVDGLVSQEVQVQASLPARKVYSITEKGREALRTWLRQDPQLPEFRNPFLVQLAWADLLNENELDDLLAAYEEEVQLQLRMEQEKLRRAENHLALEGQAGQPRTQREAYLWEKIAQNVVGVYERELAWLRELRAGLKQLKSG